MVVCAGVSCRHNDVIENYSPRCDASRRVRDAQQGDKRQINVSSLRATPLVHTVIRDGITRARTRARSRGHTCAWGCGRNYSRYTGYNWCARVDVMRTRGLNSKKCTTRRDARHQREIRARCIYGRWIYTNVVRLNSGRTLIVDLKLPKRCKNLSVEND